MSKISVNAIGDTCPIPVIKTKNAIKEMNGAGVVEVLVDNEIAVQNLTKMAKQKQYESRSEKIADSEYKVVITVGNSKEINIPENQTKEDSFCIPDSRAKKKDCGYPFRENGRRQ